jgi:beta-lactamase regulating signal transducer with metallopeptidase domain
MATNESPSDRLTLGRRDGTFEVPRALDLTWGFRRPLVLLPDSAVTWSMARLKPILLHESPRAARRLDPSGDRAVRAVYWFHPLVTWLAHRSSVERQLSCDDAVVRGRATPRLCQHSSRRGPRRTQKRASANEPSAALAAARAEGLADRVQRILDPLTARVREPRMACALGGLLAALTLGARHG